MQCRAICDAFLRHRTFSDFMPAAAAAAAAAGLSHQECWESRRQQRLTSPSPSSLTATLTPAPWSSSWLSPSLVTVTKWMIQWIRQSFKKMTHVLICLNANCLLQAKISANHSCPSTFFVYVCQQAKSRKSSRNVSSQMKEKFYRSFPTNYFWCWYVVGVSEQLWKVSKMWNVPVAVI